MFGPRIELKTPEGQCRYGKHYICVFNENVISEVIVNLGKVRWGERCRFSDNRT